VEWNAPPLEVDAGRQIEIVDSMINRRVAGIVLAPVDKQGLVAVVERGAARDSGRYLLIRRSIRRTSFRRSLGAIQQPGGWRQGGLGRRLAAKVKPGLLASCRAARRQWSASKDFRTRFASTENMLAAHTDLAGLFADNESSSTGAAQALKSRGATHVKLVAFDVSDQLIAGLRDGAIDSLIVQNPFRMGYESTRAIALKLRGEQTVRKIDSGAALIRREDLEREETKQLLLPDIQKYLRQ
jgi:ribose transport system substrate-binding protein